MISLFWSKLSEKVQKWHSNFSRPNVSWVYWLKHAKWCLHIISYTLQIFLIWKGGIWGGCAPSEVMKILQFSNLICAIWCILFGNISIRRKDHHLDDSSFSDNLNGIAIRSSYMYDRSVLILEYINYANPLYSHISICPLPPCFLWPFLSLLPLFLLFFLAFFSPPLFVPFIIFWQF